MDFLTTSITVVLALGLLGSGLTLWISSRAPKTSASLKQDIDASRSVTKKNQSRLSESEADRLRKELSKKAKIKKEVITDEIRFFRAGLMTVEDRRIFYQLKLIGPIVFSIVLGVGLYFMGDLSLGVLGLVLGAGVGLQLPKSYIDRKIAKRSEDIMFYLPLVIEQIVIGVSGSLDTGPCIQQVISMADERESHNPVTQLLRHASMVAKSGVSFEDALTETGALAGHTELKLTFKSLAQVAKHGGEITKQLKELGDTVSSMRETAIEAMIKQLELKATGPVGLVFFGFMLIFLTGLAVQVMKAFN